MREEILRIRERSRLARPASHRYLLHGEYAPLAIEKKRGREPQQLKDS
jgi:hypothetical protein